MSWLKFMRLHRDRIFACDFFTVSTLLVQELHVFFLMDLKNRSIVHWSVVKDPTGEWLGNQLRSIFSEIRQCPQYLVTDRDRKFGSWLRPLLAGFGIKLFQIPAFRPWYNGYAERMVRTFREECLDQLLIFGERDLRRVVGEYVRY